MKKENSGSENKTGKVWLAGAGPGDAGLLTVKASELIKKSDVIVYDALISTELLSCIPENVQAIYVGKHAGCHPVPQDEINRILVREAQAGKKVLRLKGGDPFVFGRGGEELEALVKEGIPFEVVPGITSCVAVPAYAGIPVTHRDYTSSFHVITGHARKDGTRNTDFASLVKLDGTIVFLMGVASMAEILSGLTDAGMDPDMPAAVLERGTTARQRRVTATVGTLEEEAERAGIGTPAVIVVGKVCALAGELHWAEDRPLGGRQFLLTRPRQNMSVLAGRLRDLGAQVIEMPAVRTRTIMPNIPLKEALLRFGRKGEGKGRWLVFTSPIGVNVFFTVLKEMKTDIRNFLAGESNVRIGAIGSATAEALEKFGLFADAVPEVYNAAELGRKIAQMSEEGEYALILRAEKGSQELLPPLVRAGMQTEDIALYRSEYDMNPILKNEVCRMLDSGEIDAVTFTSASTVHGFVKAMMKADGNQGADPGKICAVCIGVQTAEAAAGYGMNVSISDTASMDSMTEKILEMFGN